MWYSGARPRRRESLRSSLEASPCLTRGQQGSRDPGEIGREGTWCLCSDQETGHGIGKMKVWLCAWRAVPLFHPWPIVESTCNQASVPSEGPSRKEDLSDSQAKRRAEKGTWDVELMLFSEQQECLVPGGLVTALHIWGPFMGCDMKSLSKLKPCTSSADGDAIASHSFHILSGSIILALWPSSSRNAPGFFVPKLYFFLHRPQTEFISLRNMNIVCFS